MVTHLNSRRPSSSRSCAGIEHDRLSPPGARRRRLPLARLVSSPVRTGWCCRPHDAGDRMQQHRPSSPSCCRPEISPIPDRDSLLDHQSAMDRRRRPLIARRVRRRATSLCWRRRQRRAAPAGHPHHVAHLLHRAEGERVAADVELVPLQRVEKLGQMGDVVKVKPRLRPQLSIAAEEGADVGQQGEPGAVRAGARATRGAEP